MEIKITTKNVLQVLYVLSWIIFIGLCIEAGALVFNTFITMQINPTGTNTFWEGADLSDLYKYDFGYFLAMILLMGIPAVMKTIMFYLIVKVLHQKKFDLAELFSETFRRFILFVSYLALGIGLFTSWGIGYAEWLVNQGVKMPELLHQHLDGADVWLFMAITLFVIAQIFKRGIEIQDEHNLTV